MGYKIYQICGWYSGSSATGFVLKDRYLPLQFLSSSIGEHSLGRAQPTANYDTATVFPSSAKAEVSKSAVVRRQKDILEAKWVQQDVTDKKIFQDRVGKRKVGRRVENIVDEDFNKKYLISNKKP